MVKASLASVVRECDRLLRPSKLKDYDRAFNGLQVANRGQVTRLAAAVDASLATVKMAAAARADLLLVHHGLFWSPTHPWTGKRYQLLRLLLDHNLAVYSSHLPLDAHPLSGIMSGFASRSDSNACDRSSLITNSLSGLRPACGSRATSWWRAWRKPPTRCPGSSLADPASVKRSG
jgi:hypothetical protein